MENKLKLELTEEQLSFLFECVTAYSQVKFKGINTRIEPIRVAIKNLINSSIQKRIDELKEQIQALEGTKHVN